MAKNCNAPEKVAEVTTLLSGLALSKTNKQILVAIVAALSILDSQEEKTAELKIPKQTNHSYLRAKLKEYDIDEEYIGRKIMRSPSYISQRMTGKKPWQIDEAYAILDLIHIPHEQLPIYFPPKGA